MSISRPPGARAQRGVASLAVVLVLFFIVSMVAAYTGRNLIFEQRTANNQYASSQAMDAAEAGLEWALAKANQGRIDADCAASANAGDTPFRERYLAINAASGSMTATAASATCVWNGADWDCRCPTAGDALPAQPAGAGTFPAFRVRFATLATQPGVIRLESNGCTRLDANCLSFGGQGLASEGRTIVRAVVALAGALPRPPAAALTARGDIGGAMQLVNTHAPANGTAVQTGGAIDDSALQIVGLPGTPTGEAVLAHDATLPAEADNYFASFFNQWPATHRRQPVAIALDCAAGCNAATLRALAARNPGRVIWAQGDLSLDTAGDIGSAAAPLMLVVEGDVTATTPVTLRGVVYARKSDWALSGPATVRGAVVAEGGVTGADTPTIVYDRAVIDRLRLAAGSFVRVPGGWRDY
jgi:Tfp pilus assembly protein PilX